MPGCRPLPGVVVHSGWRFAFVRLLFPFLFSSLYYCISLTISIASIFSSSLYLSWVEFCSASVFSFSFSSVWGPSCRVERAAGLRRVIDTFSPFLRFACLQRHDTGVEFTMKQLFAALASAAAAKLTSITDDDEEGEKRREDAAAANFPC